MVEDLPFYGNTLSSKKAKESPHTLKGAHHTLSLGNVHL